MPSSLKDDGDSAHLSFLVPIVRQNLAKTPSILTQHINDGSTSSSVMLAEGQVQTQLDPADCPHLPPCTVRVLGADALSTAVAILRKSDLWAGKYQEEEDGDDDNDDNGVGYLDAVAETGDNGGIARGKTIVLNSCSDEAPGGRYSLLASSAKTVAAHAPSTAHFELPSNHHEHTTQEESICLSTTLYPTLSPTWYPRPSTGVSSVHGIYSPGVVIFRDPTTLQELPPPEHHVISVLSIAAPHGSSDGSGASATSADPNPADLQLTLTLLRRKIRFFLRTAAANGHERLVLGGAWGCGSHACPAELVAREMRATLLESEFSGWFREVVFAIRERGAKGQGGNLKAFCDALDGVVI